MIDLTPIAAFILGRFAPRGTARVHELTSLVDSGWLDSFAIVELVSFLEDQYRVTLRAEDVLPANFENLTSIRGILARARPR